jgi:21S rRNA (GM2251-2'-O)-methyltransferase
VLEASALLKTPILSLSPISHDRTTFSYQKAQHDITNSGIILNDLPSTLPNRDPPRYPFILMLDEILDPGNLGAMLRSAYYLGCSAVLVSERNCAPLSPTCLKSSAGAAEYIPILTQTSPSRFIVNSQKAGWRFFAAVPPLRGNRSQSRKGRHVRAEDEDVRKALREAPTVLVMGGEGEGLRDTLSKACDRFVSIGNANDVDRGVDSLNVSVAAGVLCQAFLGKR